MEAHGLYFLLDYYAHRKGRVVWVDLGCGNGIALRQAKKWFTGAYGAERLSAIGYDILPFDSFEYKYRTQDNKKGHSGNYYYFKDDLDPKYEPQIFTEDITTASFPETPDIITCFQVLQWTTNPLEIFANAASQMGSGSVFNVFGLDNIFYENDRYSDQRDYLFRKIAIEKCGLPGFDFVYPRDVYSIPSSPEFLIRNSDAVSDFTFGFTHHSSKNPWDNMRDDYYRWFNSFYTKPNNQKR